MNSLLAGFVSIIVAISMSGCATTSSDGVRQVRFDKTAKTGQRQSVGHNWHLNPDCTVTHVPNVRVIEPPLHGSLALVREQAVVTNAKGLFAKCNSLKLPMIGYYYQSTPGYIGKDRFVARVAFGDGNVKDRVTSIKVEK